MQSPMPSWLFDDASHSWDRRRSSRVCRSSNRTSNGAPSTVGDILQSRGMVEGRVRRRRPIQPTRVPRKPTAPNDQMTMDYKGQFRLGDRRYCYPLTIVDRFSRYILACAALTSTRYEAARKVIENVFRTYGLPRSILSDNGSPWCGRFGAALTFGGVVDSIR